MAFLRTGDGLKGKKNWIICKQVTILGMSYTYQSKYTSGYASVITLTTGK